MCVSTVRYIMKATTAQGKTIKEHYMHKDEGTLLQTYENIISELSLNIEFNPSHAKGGQANPPHVFLE